MCGSLQQQLSLTRYDSKWFVCFQTLLLAAVAQVVEFVPVIGWRVGPSPPPAGSIWKCP